MRTLSNAELQEAILKAHWLAKNSTGAMSNKAHDHYDMLIDEQMKRATERTELTLEPMTTTLERAEFDARVEAQDGPNRTKLSPSEIASLLIEDLFALTRDHDGPPIRRIEFKSGSNGNGEFEKSHGGMAKDPLEKWVSEWLENWGGL